VSETCVGGIYELLASKQQRIIPAVLRSKLMLDHHCPKCETLMRTVGPVFAIPAARDVKAHPESAAISTATALPVLPYHCPKCGYIELYYLDLS